VICTITDLGCFALMLFTAFAWFTIGYWCGIVDAPKWRKL